MVNVQALARQIQKQITNHYRAKNIILDPQPLHKIQMIIETVSARNRYRPDELLDATLKEIYKMIDHNIQIQLESNHSFDTRYEMKEPPPRFNESLNNLRAESREMEMNFDSLQIRR